MKKLILAAFATMLSAVSATAVVYQWEDDSGTIGFTDNRNNIPMKYRNKAREREIGTYSPPRRVPPSGETAAERGNVAPGGPLTDTEETIGGYGMVGWQALFRNLRSEIGTVSARIVENRNKLAKLHRERVLYQRPADRIAYNDLSGVIERDEGSLRELQVRLSALQTEADRLAVPQEWRQ